MDASPTMMHPGPCGGGAGRLFPVACLAVGLAACSAAGKTSAERDTASQPGGGDDTGDDSDVTDTASGPAYWRLDAVFPVDAGAVVPETAVLDLRVIDDAGEELCAESVTPTSWVDETPLPHETVLTWWRVSLPADGWSCFDADEGPRAGSLLLGVGAMHPEVSALVGRLDEADGGTGAHLNGAYAGLPGDDRLLVFGAVGTTEAWAGKAEPAESAPLDDGTWQLRAVYSFPL